MLTPSERNEIDALLEKLSSVASFDIQVTRPGFSLRMSRSASQVHPSLVTLSAPLAAVFVIADSARIGAMVEQNAILAFLQLGSHRIALRAPHPACVTEILAATNTAVSKGYPLFRLQHLFSNSEGHSPK